MQTYTDFGSGWRMRQIINGRAITYDVTIDNHRMGQLAEKASRNKSLRTKMGALTIKIVHNLPAQGETQAAPQYGRTLSD